MNPDAASVSFDVLFRTRGSGAQASAATLEAFRPEPAQVAAARRWLEQRGVTCHDAGLTLACSASAAVFAKLFGTTASPVVPGDLGAWVEAVTVAPLPDLH